MEKEKKRKEDIVEFLTEGKDNHETNAPVESLSQYYRLLKEA